MSTSDVSRVSRLALYFIPFWSPYALNAERLKKQIKKTAFGISLCISAAAAYEQEGYKVKCSSIYSSEWSRWERK